MTRASSILVLFVLFAFGLSLAVPAEDVPETGYDESEGLPYEGTPLFPTVPLAAARTRQSSPRSAHLEVVVPSQVAPACGRDAGPGQSAGARVSLALLCILLC